MSQILPSHFPRRVKTQLFADHISSIDSVNIKYRLTLATALAGDRLESV